MMRAASFVSVMALFLLPLGCFEEGEPGSDEHDQGSCADVSGRWTIDGDCGSDLCTIEQTGCSTVFDCMAGTAAYSGSVSGNAVSFTGTTAGGLPGTCQGTISGSEMSGTCTVHGFSCTFSANR
jgi:hypothetical protein